MRGFATPQRTALRAGRLKNLAYRRLGRTGLWVSGVGFGGYRIDLDHADHERALYQALSQGINLVDTSTNYTDGQSEQLVGKVLRRCVDEGLLDREDVVVVSKVGYLQGSNYQLSQTRKSEGRPFPELVEVDRGLEHCIHPDFLANQLDQSLERLGLETLDVLLLHNPEYFLTTAQSRDQDEKAARTIYEDRLNRAFQYLETQVEAGRIRFYGVSSNTFPVARDRYDFTDLQRCWALAAENRTLAKFAVVQFPMNLVEHDAAVLENQANGQTLLEACQNLQLGVLLNRPLNAIVGNTLVRLAEADTFFSKDHPQFDQLVEQCLAIRQHVAEADPAWSVDETLSHTALRALLSTAGVGSVLVGMRHPDYVADVMACLKKEIRVNQRRDAWNRVHIH